MKTETGLNVPHSWAAMRYFDKLTYLVNTHQAKNIEEAKVKIRAPWKPKPQPVPSNYRHPYAD